ncbi:PEP-CTERM sorting domain-containing protein [uncultured Akkermansia sp.]|nr:PEP-CTERM sorting domain-containing protein [uncultured Akkermansia sp.]
MLGGISQAATYVWSGAANNGIYGDSGNWTVNGAPNGYYPQNSKNDNAIIGQDAGTITWSSNETYFGDTNTIQIGSGSTLVCKSSIGDLNVNSITLEGNAHLVFESTNALGLGRDFTLNFGMFTASEHGSWTATDIPSLWANHQTVYFTGTLDMNSLIGSGTIELANIKSDQRDGPLTLDLSGLNIASTSQIQANVTQVTENGITKVIVNYETVPEPTTFSLGILGLGGLLLRRRRK